MGEKQEVGLYYKADEEWVKFDGLTQAPEFHPDQDFDCSSFVIGSWDAEIVGKLNPEKNLRCKTRKRFVKLLMSIGFQRDRAVTFAKETRECMPYSAAWWWISLMGGINCELKK